MVVRVLGRNPQGKSAMEMPLQREHSKRLRVISVMLLTSVHVLSINVIVVWWLIIWEKRGKMEVYDCF